MGLKCEIEKLGHAHKYVHINDHREILLYVCVCASDIPFIHWNEVNHQAAMMAASQSTQCVTLRETDKRREREIGACVCSWWYHLHERLWYNKFIFSENNMHWIGLGWARLGSVPRSRIRLEIKCKNNEQINYNEQRVQCQAWVSRYVSGIFVD